MLTILLPYPPATNSLFINLRRGGRARSKRYNEWIDEAVQMVWRQQVPEEPINYPVSVEIAVGKPDKRRRDLDGIIKPVLDLMERAGVYENDSQVHRLNIWWDPDVYGIQCDIMPIGEV